MLYTRKGDGGESGLYGTTGRFPKDSPVYEALGSLDELNSLLGLCFALAPEDATMPARDMVRGAQQSLFVLQAELAGAGKSLSQERVAALEDSIARVEAKIQNPHAFVLPGGSVRSAYFDVARAHCRRAERAVVAASRTRAVSAASLSYLNRLSSLLYALARFEAQGNALQEEHPTY